MTEIDDVCIMFQSVIDGVAHCLPLHFHGTALEVVLRAQNGRRPVRKFSVVNEFIEQSDFQVSASSMARANVRLRVAGFERF